MKVRGANELVLNQILTLPLSFEQGEAICSRCVVQIF